MYNKTFMTEMAAIAEADRLEVVVAESATAQEITIVENPVKYKKVGNTTRT